MSEAEQKTSAGQSAAAGQTALDKKRRTRLGILFLCISSFCFATMGLFVNLAGELPVWEKSFFRNSIAAVFALGYLLVKKSSWHVGRKNWGTLIARAAAGTLGILFNFYALSHLPLSDASMLSKIAPFATLLFSWLILKERLRSWQFGLMALALVGSIFVIQPSFSNVNLFASVIGFAGGIVAGLAYTLLRKVRTGGVAGPFIVFFFSAFSSIAMIPLMIYHYVPLTLNQFLCLLATGLFAAIAQFSITAAYNYAPAREISIYDYSQVLYSMIYGLIFLQVFPDAWSLVGYVIILGVAVINYVLTRRVQDKEEREAGRG